MTQIADIPLDAPCSFCGGPVQVPEHSLEEDMVLVTCLNPECGLPDGRLNPQGGVATWRRAKATAQAYGYDVSSPPQTPDEAVQQLTNMIAAGMLQRQGVPPGPLPLRSQPQLDPKPNRTIGILRALGRTLLFVVIFHVLIVGSLALGRAVGLGRLLFDVVTFLLFVGILRLLASLFSRDPIVLARDPALWVAVAVMTALAFMLR